MHTLMLDWRKSWLTAGLGLLLASSGAGADLVPLDEAELSRVEGRALGVLFEDIKIISDIAGVTQDFDGNVATETTQATFDVSTSNNDALRMSHFYLVGASSPSTTDIAQATGFSVGSLDDPVTLLFPTQDSGVDVLQPHDPNDYTDDVYDASNPTRSAMILCWSGSDCSTPTNIVTAASGANSTADMGIRLQLDYDLNAAVETEDLWVALDNFKIDRSWLAIWPDESYGLSLAANLYMEANQLQISTQEDEALNTGDFDTPETTFTANDIVLDLQLGHPFYQPVTLSTGTSVNGGSAYAELQLQVERLPNVAEIYNQFYTADTNRTDIRIGSINFGGYNMTPDVNAPVQEVVNIQDLQIQHLVVKTKDVTTF